MFAVKFWKPITLTAAITVSFLIDQNEAKAAEAKTLTVAGGCFWCVESDFEKVPGVLEAISGFSGGTTPDPTYKDVVKGGSGHLEAVQISYDPDVVSFEQLLSLFVRSIDPLDAGGQFCDRGESYSTAIFVSNSAEKDIAEQVVSNGEVELSASFATRILLFDAFYQADSYHQDYYKSDVITLTRFGPKKRSEAYKRYREGCGRDARVLEVWGNDAPFVTGQFRPYKPES